VQAQEMGCCVGNQLWGSVCHMFFINSEFYSVSLKSPYLTLIKAAFTETGIAREFNVSKEVTILGVSLFVVGLGLGPLLVGPLSELHGRNIIYQVSYALFFIFSWPIAFAPNIGM
jgi:MFS family permease